MECTVAIKRRNGFLLPLLRISSRRLQVPCCRSRIPLDPYPSENASPSGPGQAWAHPWRKGVVGSGKDIGVWILPESCAGRTDPLPGAVPVWDAGNVVALVGKTPDAATTDVLLGFASWFCGALPGGRRVGTLHRKDSGIRKRHSNNTYECFNGTLKDRLESVRGFHSPLYGLYLAYYDLFRPHSGMGRKTPAEALGIILKGSDKRMTTIWPVALSGI